MTKTEKNNIEFDELKDEIDSLDNDESLNQVDTDEDINEENLSEEEQDNEENLSEEEEDNEENLSEEEEDEVVKLKEALARKQADYENFKMRVERDKVDMVHFLKVDIFKKILPRIDDIDRILKNTPEDQRTGALYEGLLAMEKSFKRDLDSLGVKPFDSLGEEVNPDKHEVMTQAPAGEDKSGIIIDEFEKGYMVGDRVLRVAKVVVGA